VAYSLKSIAKGSLLPMTANDDWIKSTFCSQVPPDLWGERERNIPLLPDNENGWVEMG